MKEEDAPTRRLLLVAPYRDEEAFVDTLSRRLDASVSCLTYRTDAAVARGVWRRHLLILRMAWRAFRQRGEYDFILFGEQFVGLYYALFCRLLPSLGRPPRTLVLQLIYNRRAGIGGRLYHGLYRWLIASPALDHLVCHAALERQYYRAEFGPRIAGKITFVPFGRGKPLGVETAPALPDEYGHDYFFSGGTSNRDYRSLVEAFKGLDERLVIACHADDLRGLDLPPNVLALHDAFDARFQACIVGACAVILTIRSTEVSAGQLVLIDAMRLGKPAIVTAGSCMEDYADDSCAIRVRKQDIAAIRQAVSELANDAQLRESLGHVARQRYERLFTRAAFARRLGELLLGESERTESAVAAARP